jgi:hypothetical protein
VWVDFSCACALDDDDRVCNSSRTRFFSERRGRVESRFCGCGWRLKEEEKFDVEIRHDCDRQRGADSSFNIQFDSIQAVSILPYISGLDVIVEDLFAPHSISSVSHTPYIVFESSAEDRKFQKKVTYPSGNEYVSNGPGYDSMEE